MVDYKSVSIVYEYIRRPQHMFLGTDMIARLMAEFAGDLDDYAREHLESMAALASGAAALSDCNYRLP